MPKGAVSTPAVPEVTVLVVNQKPVKNIQELKQILDSLTPGANVAISFQAQGKTLAIESVVKQK